MFRTCLQIVAAMGDEDSETLRKALGFSVFGADRKERGVNIPPELLALYREAESKGGFTDICVDMKELDYISSAGLRVLLIMKKAIGESGDFSLINMSDAVKEIIETTRFDTIFC